MTEQPQRKKKRKRASPFGPMRDVARMLYAEQSLTPAAIDAELLRRFPDSLERPTRRTIEGWVAEFRIVEGESWTLTRETADDAELVLPALHAIVHLSNGRLRTIGVETARWIVAVRRAARDLEPWQAYRVARWYQVLTTAGDSTEALDLYLAFAPWRSPEAEDRYVAAVREGRIPAVPYPMDIKAAVYVALLTSWTQDRQILRDADDVEPLLRRLADGELGWPELAVAATAVLNGEPVDPVIGLDAPGVGSDMLEEQSRKLREAVLSARASGSPVDSHVDSHSG